MKRRFTLLTITNTFIRVVVTIFFLRIGEARKVEWEWTVFSSIWIVSMNQDRVPQEQLYVVYSFWMRTYTTWEFHLQIFILEIEWFSSPLPCAHMSNKISVTILCILKYLFRPDILSLKCNFGIFEVFVGFHAITLFTIREYFCIQAHKKRLNGRFM